MRIPSFRFVCALLLALCALAPALPAQPAQAAAAFVDDSAADFAAGTLDSGVQLYPSGGGMLSLRAAVSSEFPGNALPHGMFTTSYTTGDDPSIIMVEGGLLIIDGAQVASVVDYPAGVRIEATATFGAVSEQYIGFASTSSSGPHAILHSYGGLLIAETEAAPLQVAFLPLVIDGTAHDFAIEWTASAVRYYVDGSLAVTHDVNIDGQMQVVGGDLSAPSEPLLLDSVAISPYSPTGSYLSRVFDARGLAEWGVIDWQSSVPAGTSLAVAVRSGSTPEPDATWSAFQAVSSGGDLPNQSRYIQYRAEFATTTPTQAPKLHQLSIGYTATPESDPPQITQRSPAPQMRGVPLTAPVTVKFDEPLDPASVTTATFRLRAEGAGSDLPAAVTYQGLTATLTPAQPLHIGVLYTVTLDGLTDGNGNPLAPTTWTFRASFNGEMVDTTIADFQAGTLELDAVITDTAGGEISVRAASGSEFSGPILPAGWLVEQYPASGSGGTATLQAGRLVVDGARIGPYDPFFSGTTLDFAAMFNGGPNQWVGFRSPDPDGPWAIFSTDETRTTLKAFTNPGGGQPMEQTYLPGDYFSASHQYAIQWDTGEVIYRIDGVQVARHVVTIPLTPMRALAAEQGASVHKLPVDWMRVSPYGFNGHFYSRVFDATRSAHWTSLSWDSNTAPGGALVVEARSGDTPTPGPGWMPFIPVPLPGNPGLAPGRYFQYRVSITSFAPQFAMALNSVHAAYRVPVAPEADDAAVYLAEDSPAPLLLAAVDGNDDPLTYTIESGPSHGTLTGTAPMFLYTPAPNWHGTDSILFHASDDGSTSNTATITIHVLPVNDAPVITPPGDQLAAAGQPYQLAIQASDVDLPPATLTFSLIEAPAGMVIDPASGSLTWTPAADLRGSYPVTVQVSDGSAVSTGSFAVTVVRFIPSHWLYLPEVMR